MAPIPPLPLPLTAVGKLQPFILSALTVTFFFFVSFFFFSFSSSKNLLYAALFASASSSFHQAVLSALWIIFWFSGLLSRCDSNTFFSLCGWMLPMWKRYKFFEKNFPCPSVLHLTVIICFN